MALPKKALRKITVDTFRYAWSATGNDGGIHLSIAPLDNVGQLLTTTFGYHSSVISELTTPDGFKIQALQQQLVITPYIVRQVIQQGLGKGWNPREKGPQFSLSDIENAIDLRLGNGTE